MPRAPVQLDLLDAAAVAAAVRNAKPDAIIHEATALGGGGFSRNTLWLELFTSVISGGAVLFGLGLTFGSYHGYERSPLMAAGASNRAGFAGR